MSLFTDNLAFSKQMTFRNITSGWISMKSNVVCFCAFDLKPDVTCLNCLLFLTRICWMVSEDWKYWTTSTVLSCCCSNRYSSQYLLCVLLKKWQVCNGIGVNEWRQCDWPHSRRVQVTLEEVKWIQRRSGRVFDRLQPYWRDDECESDVMTNAPLWTRGGLRTSCRCEWRWMQRESKHDGEV